MAAMSKKPERSRSTPFAWRRALAISLAILSFAGAVYAAQQVEQFLIRDQRFALTPPVEYGDESPGLHLTGVKFAARGDILRVFQPDVGRSLYLFPMADRRKALLRVPWVKDASILRTWPNQITVRITERQPVAFLEVGSESISRWFLVDADGIVLDLPHETQFDLPVVSGVRPHETQPVRALRIHRMMRLLDDLGPARNKISDVDVADIDNLKLTLKVDQRAIVLLMGDHNFQTRFQHFMDHYDEIRKHVSDVAILDLQLDGHIFSVPTESKPRVSVFPERRP